MIKIYINYFGSARILRNDFLTPIQVGRALARVKLDMLGDDSGDNISAKNPAYCELTGQYWAWKNDHESTHLGFMHYRRFLDFYSEKKRSNDSIHGSVEPGFGKNFIEEYGLDEERLKEIVLDYDMILPRPFDVTQVGCKSLEQQYKVNPHHHARDFEAARNVVAELYPEDLKYFDRMASGRMMYPTNMFIFKRDLFEEYCEWLFNILDSLNDSIDVTGYSAPERRAVGYLAERLLTVFILKKKETAPHLKVKELRRVFVQNTWPEPVTPGLPETSMAVVSVVASSDAAYLPHIGALIASVFSNASHEKFIDFVVLDGGLADHDRMALQGLTELHPHSSVSFVDMSKEFLEYDIHSYFTRSTFFRLAMPDILHNRKKVLFLDTDMVALGDVTELYATELDGKCVAVVADLIMRSFCAKGVRATSQAKMVPAHTYLSDNLGMQGRTSEYFQAGTILFDLERIRAECLSERMMRDLRDNHHWFLDQDVLNKHLLGKTKFLDHAWNTVTIDQDHLDYLAKADQVLYEKSHQLPKVIHFAGVGKPWVNSVNPFSQYYWFYLRRTPWYEMMLFAYLNGAGAAPQVSDTRVPSVLAPRSFQRRVLSKVWRATPPRMKSIMLPVAIKLSQRIQ